MIPLQYLFEATLEIPDGGVQPYELIRLARKKKLITPNGKNNMPNLKEGEFAVPMLDQDKKKKQIINPLTGRKKGKKNARYLVTTIKPEERTLNNLPRYANKKPKVRFQDWLMLNKDPKLYHKYDDVSWGWSPNEKVFGWSHRAVHGFGIGDKIKKDTIGNWKEKDWIIKTKEEAERMAKEFARDVA